MTGKLTGIVPTGTYYDLWFPYVIASMYPVCDEIIVVNAGFDLKHPNEKESMVPVEQVSKDIERLDKDGIVKEIVEFENDYEIISKKKALDAGLNYNWWEGTYWCDPRGRNFDVANKIAKELGATWTLLMASDMVLYDDVVGLRNDPQPLVLYAYEFIGVVGRSAPNKIYHSADKTETQPFRPGDAPALYPSKELLKFGGCACGLRPLCHTVLEPTEKYHVTHLRGAVPVDSTEEEWLERFYEKWAFLDWCNHFGEFSDAVFERARHTAQSTVKLIKSSWKSSDYRSHTPPEVTLLSRKELADSL